MRHRFLDHIAADWSGDSHHAVGHGLMPAWRLFSGLLAGSDIHRHRTFNLHRFSRSIKAGHFNHSILSCRRLEWIVMVIQRTDLAIPLNAVAGQIRSFVCQFILNHDSSLPLESEYQYAWIFRFISTSTSRHARNRVRRWAFFFAAESLILEFTGHRLRL